MSMWKDPKAMLQRLIIQGKHGRSSGQANTVHTMRTVGNGSCPSKMVYKYTLEYPLVSHKKSTATLLGSMSILRVIDLPISLGAKRRHPSQGDTGSIQAPLHQEPTTLISGKLRPGKYEGVSDP
ncbi:hypothetical protein GOP47_0018453 [Adiantum capillus-veneris]|uniref:Uncharacterized protein n=1 Tax=Adiantum capillus-veneris TaxID=13818 RepID=A0A9D4Z8S8_ADICA|nr:hypothetical protein GOP47_0018453 [Adiantum capillus-veneris]